MISNGTPVTPIYILNGIKSGRISPRYNDTSPPALSFGNLRQAARGSSSHAVNVARLHRFVSNHAMETLLERFRTDANAFFGYFRGSRRSGISAGGLSASAPGNYRLQRCGKSILFWRFIRQQIFFPHPHRSALLFNAISSPNGNWNPYERLKRRVSNFGPQSYRFNSTPVFRSSCHSIRSWTRRRGFGGETLADSSRCHVMLVGVEGISRTSRASRDCMHKSARLKIQRNAYDQSITKPADLSSFLFAQERPFLLRAIAAFLFETVTCGIFLKIKRNHLIRVADKHLTGYARGSEVFDNERIRRGNIGNRCGCWRMKIPETTGHFRNELAHDHS